MVFGFEWSLDFEQWWFLRLDDSICEFVEDERRFSFLWFVKVFESANGCWMNHSSSLKYSYDRVFFFFLPLVEVIQYDAISNVYGNEKSSMFLVFSIYLMIYKVRSWIQFFDIFSEFERVILLSLSINLKLSIAILRWKLNLSIFHFPKVSVSFKFPEAISRVHSNFTEVWSKRSLLRIPNHFLVLPKLNLFENWGRKIRIHTILI